MSDAVTVSRRDFLMSATMFAGVVPTCRTTPAVIGAIVCIGSIVQSPLFGVTPFGPVSPGTVIGIVTLVAVAATQLPGVQALRRMPVSILRKD